MLYYLIYLSWIGTVYWLIDRFVTPISLAWIGCGISFLTFRQLKQVLGVQRPVKVKVFAKKVMRGSPDKMAKAFCKVHCSFEKTKDKESLETYQIQQLLVSLQTFEVGNWLGLSWALRKIFTRKQTFSTPKFVRIADDLGNLFVLKKSRKTWSSVEERKTGKIKKRNKIRANF